MSQVNTLDDDDQVFDDKNKHQHGLDALLSALHCQLILGKMVVEDAGIVNVSVISITSFHFV